MSDEIGDRLLELDARVRRLEDERRIADVISRYCYFADARCDPELLDLFTPDGALASKAAGVATVTQGRGMLAAQIADPAGHRHPDVYGRGLHLLGNNLVIEIDGATARASSYSVYLVRRAGELVVSSASSNGWVLRRGGDDGWLIVSRDRRPIADEDFAEVLMIGIAPQGDPVRASRD